MPKKKAAERGKYTRLIQVWVTDEIDDGIDALVARQPLVPKAAYVRMVLEQHVQRLANRKAKS